MLSLCRELGIEAVVPEREVAKHDGAGLASSATVVADLAGESVDLCLALGGDGTILRSLSRFKDMQTPVLGVNFGRVGYLSAIGPDEIGDGLKTMLKGDFELAGLSLLRAGAGDSARLAINDVVVQKPAGASVVRLAYEIDGVAIDSFQSDGLVAATPAGSTAYNLSNGGPLLSLKLEAFVLTAIAPHALRFRALAIAPGERLLVRNESVAAEAQVFIDGHPDGSVPPGDSIEITLAERQARLVRRPGSSFFTALRDKFILR